MPRPRRVTGPPQQDRAIILRLTDYGEADRVATLLCQRLGRVSAMAKSARRSRKRFGGALDLFCQVRAELRTRRGADLLLLERVELEEGFLPLRQSPEALLSGSFVLELARQLTRDGQRVPGLFEHASAALQTLASEPDASLPRSATVLVSFGLAALGVAGFRPELERCVSCGDVVQPGAAQSPLRLDILRGGVLCERCPSPEVGRPMLRVRPATLSALRALQAEGPGALESAALSARAAAGSLGLIERFVQVHAGRPLETAPRLLNALRAASGEASK